MPANLSRRSFFQKLKPSSGGKPASNRSNNRDSILSNNLDPFAPDTNNPWDEIRAGHLLRRTMMSPTWSDIESLVKLGDPGKAVDLLLSQWSTPAEPSTGENLREDPATQSNQVVIENDESLIESDAAVVRAWWATLQQSATLSIQEKMVFFWSCHFTTAFDLGNETYVSAPLLYRQNNLFRTYGNGAQNGPLGNFKTLVQQVTLDGAMLVYLGGNLNVAGAPNENYARELMELFTCGIGGGYTQADVQAGARILTGWKIPQFSQLPAPNGNFVPYMLPSDHDIQDKKYLTQDFPATIAADNNGFQVTQNEIDKMVDVLFEQTGLSIATYISTKLYKFFVYSNTDTSDSDEQGVIAAMAALFIQNNWEIKPVVSALLKSEHFFDNINIGAQIKTPAEYVIGLARQIVPTANQKSFAIDGNMTNDGQQFFQPPNVSGWPGYHDWITTNTYPTRGTQATAVVKAMQGSDLMNFIEQFGSSIYTDVNQLSAAIGQLLLPRPLSTARATTFAQTLAGTTQTYEWSSLLSSNPATAENNIRNLLNYIIALPDFELC